MGLARSEGYPMESEGRHHEEERRREEDRHRDERRLRREEARHLEEERRLREELRAAEQQRIDEERSDWQTVQRPTSPLAEQRLPPVDANVNIASVPRERSPSRSLRSQRSTETTRRLNQLQLQVAKKRAEVLREKIKLKEAEAEIAELTYRQELNDDEEARSVRNEPDDAGADRKVDMWLENTTPSRHRPAEQTWEPRDRSRTPCRSKCTSIDKLAEAIEKMSRSQRRYNELPTYSGSTEEWLVFKAAMIESTKMNNIPPAENILRLRACLKGAAREAVSVLLHSATDPDVIMSQLERCFGKPQMLIDHALEDLRKLPKLGGTSSEINNYAMKVQNFVYISKNVGDLGYEYDPSRVVLEKFSRCMAARWYHYAAEHKSPSVPKIELLSRFLLREADRAIEYDYVPRPAPSKTTAHNTGTKKKTAIYTTREEETRCVNCDGTHTLSKCHVYLALPVNQRWELVRNKKLCFRCIESTHRRFRCQAKLCGVKQCRRPHHATLHEENNVANQRVAVTEGQSVDEPKKEDAVVLSVTSTAATDSSAVLLKVCPVTVSEPRGEINTYALLDEGATITLIDEDLAKSIGAEGPTRPLNMSGVNMSQREKNSREVHIFVKGKGETESFRLRGRTIRDLSLRRQSVPLQILQYRHLRDLHEEVCYEQANPRILVGADHWELIVSRELRIGGPKEPAASRTQLGWVVHGTVPRNAIRQDPESVLHVYTPDLCVHEKREQDQRLHELIERHFAIDSLGIASKPRESDADRRAREIFTRTVKKIDGGYEVGLPWRRDHDVFPPSYTAAVNRLRGIECKMNADPAFAKDYAAQIDNLLTKGYAVPCDGTETTSLRSWFLPHFAVENPNKPGKKRLVFDAAHRNRGVCLNDGLLEGPDMLRSLLGILFRFREQAVAVIADVQEMFLQIKIRPEDQPAQQFLWRGVNRTGPPRLYKMTRLIFGAACSPFIAHSVRDYNAHKHADTHPRALVAITESHYMDDYVDSYADEDEARRTNAEVREVHAVACFTLRGWCSNIERVLSDVPTELRATELSKLGGAAAESKILGLRWHADTDELAFNTAMQRVPTEVRERRRAPTKREALGVVMSIYDPLGLLSQYTIRAKIVLQSLWRLRVSWNEPLPEEEADQFSSWLQQLHDITKLRLLRCYGITDALDLELHVLCDASEQAYATVAYWRATRHDGDVTISLVAAKSKVAPKRTLSIPRLELQAAVIGARLADTIKQEQRLVSTRTVYWTESATVVHWLKNDSRRYTPFVAHRLGEIAELTHRNEWRWLPTELNVADDATRQRGGSITADDRWFTGPSFLKSPEAEWPAQRLPLENDDTPEVLHTNERDESSSHWTPDPARFSKYERLVRATARVLAFIDLCRRRATQIDLQHIERAEHALMRRAQEESFADDIRRLEAGRPITRTSRLYRLDPVLEEGLLRVRGRIGASKASVETKCPLILDGRHALSRLLVLQEHCRAGHANRERVTNDLRQRYWIIHLRPTVRAVEHDCAFCRVRKARPFVPSTGDLPKARVDSFCGDTHY